MRNVIYTVEFAPRIEKQLKLIPKDERESIIARIEKLKKNPRPENIEPLHGADDGLYRIRQGNYRIVYVHRKEFYKKKHSK